MAGPVFVTVRSADVATVAVAVAVLFVDTGSVVVAATVAVFVIVLPAGSDEAARTTSENVADAALTSVAAVQEMLPVPPAAGVVHVNVGPAVCVSDTNVVPAGTASVTVTPAASEGPPFAAVIVYVRFVPAVALAGPLFVIARSAATPTVAVAVAALFAGRGSEVVVDTVAVFVIVVPFAADGGIMTTSENVAELPLASVAALQVTVPVPPAAGVVQVNAGPAVWVIDTNVVLVGMASVSDGAWASEGPLSATVMV